MKQLMFILFTLCCVTAHAVQVEKLVLKDGSVLEGYISSQRFNGDFIFTSEKALICVPAEEVVSVSSHEVKLEQLLPEWREWAKESDVVHDGYVRMNEIVRSRKIRASDSMGTDSVQIIEKQQIDDVRVLEKGVTLKYLEQSLNEYSLNMNEVVCIKRNRREKAELTGLKDIITLRDLSSELEGQIIEQFPGKQVRLLKNDGLVESIMQSQILKQRKEGINPNQTLIEQSPLLDIFVLKTKKRLEGVIIEQFFGSNELPGYLLILKKDGKTEKVAHRELAETRRVINPDYKMLTDVILSPDEIQIDRKPAKEALTEEADDFIVFLPESDSTVVQLDSIRGKLILEANFRDQHDADDLMLMRLRLNTSGEKELHGFTYKNLVNFGIRCSGKEISPNQTIKLTFPIKSKGHYAVYMGKKKRAYLCVIR